MVGIVKEIGAGSGKEEGQAGSRSTKDTRQETASQHSADAKRCSVSTDAGQAGGSDSAPSGAQRGVSEVEARTRPKRKTMRLVLFFLSSGASGAVLLCGQVDGDAKKLVGIVFAMSILLVFAAVYSQAAAFWKGN